MLKSFIGSHHFTAGMRSYLQKYAYGNAQTDELWESMSEVSYEVSDFFPTLFHFMILTTWSRKRFLFYRQDKTIPLNFITYCFYKVSGVNVKEVMDTWTLQMGLPVVNIVRLDEETATADQKRFLIYPDAKHHHSSPFK